MGISVNAQNVNQVTNLFANFAKEELAKGKQGSIAYLFPGHSTRLVMSLTKPIFAAESHVFRSKTDKNVNDYVRDVFMHCVATKLKCAISDLPRVFKWAGVLDDLKVADFGKGRPLTARRIDAILAAVGKIEAKYKYESVGMDFAREQGVASDRTKIADMASDGLTDKELSKLPTFNEGIFVKDTRFGYGNNISDVRTDRNVAYALEQADEVHATQVGSTSFGKATSVAIKDLKGKDVYNKIQSLRSNDHKFAAREEKVRAKAVKRFGEGDPRVDQAVYAFGKQYLLDQEKNRILNHPLHDDFIKAQLARPENQALDPKEVREQAEKDFAEWIMKRYPAERTGSSIETTMERLFQGNDADEEPIVDVIA